MVVSPVGRPTSGALTRLVRWSTRLVCLAAVPTQAALLSIELRRGAPLGDLAGQFALFAATVVLAAAGFWLTARMRPADPLLRLRRSEALRLAAVGRDGCGWAGLPGRCAGVHRPAA
jgi:hypothetical protein